MKRGRKYARVLIYLNIYVKIIERKRILKGRWRTLLKIGRAELKYGLMLAPMAGFTDRAMRLVCHKFGAEYLISEMVSAKAVCYKDRKTADLARILPDEGKCAVQIFG